MGAEYGQKKPRKSSISKKLKGLRGLLEIQGSKEKEFCSGKASSSNCQAETFQ
jgi:hypothetical protein